VVHAALADLVIEAPRCKRPLDRVDEIRLFTGQVLSELPDAKLCECDIAVVTISFISALPSMGV